MPRLWLRKLTSIGAVPEGDNPDARVLLWKSKRDFPQEDREDMADRGVAMPDGSYPIPDKDALRRAIQSFGRASDPAAVRAHIIRRARALGATDMLPEDWQQKGVDGVDELVEKIDEVEAEQEAVDPAGTEADFEPVEAEVDEVAKRIADAEVELQKARDERDAALQTLNEEVAKRRHAEFIGKARTLEGLLGPADEVAPHLEALEAAQPDAYAELEKRLHAALERVQLTKEIGTAGDEGADPLRKQAAWVLKYVEDHPDIPVEKARALFWKFNPDALEARREEQS